LINKNEYLVWNELQCFIMNLNYDKISSIYNNINISFNEIDFIKTKYGSGIRFDSFVKYNNFIICIGGTQDEGDDGMWIIFNEI